MGKKLTIEEVKNFVEVASNSGCELLSVEYKNNNELLSFKCKCGTPFPTTFDKFKTRNKRQCNDYGNILRAQNNKYDYEEIKSFIEIESLSGCVLKTSKEDYLDSKQLLDLVCHCRKTTFQIDFTRFKCQKQECNNCSNESRIYNNFLKKKQEVEEKIISMNFKLLLPYQSCDISIAVENQEGYKANILYDYLVRNGKPSYFNSSNPFTISNIKLWVSINDKSFSLESNTYIDNENDLTWKCKKCNEEWGAPWNRIYNTGTECPYCNKNRPSSTYNLLRANQDLCHEWDYLKNIKQPNEYLPNSHDYVFWKCSKCNHSWEAMIKARNNGSGCPTCNEPKAEKKCKEIFLHKGFIEIAQNDYNNLINKNNNTYFIAQKTFDGLIGLGNGLLSYDFYLPNHNSLIEVQGLQHQKPVDFNGNGEKYAKEAFEQQKIHDRCKKEYALLNGYNFLEIWYYDFNNIEEILNKYIEDINKISKFNLSEKTPI